MDVLEQKDPVYRGDIIPIAELLKALFSKSVLGQECSVKTFTVARI